MKQLFIVLFNVVIVQILSAQPELHKAISYNIRYDGHSDLASDWKIRKAPIIEMLHQEKPSVIGFQEVLLSQLKDLELALPSYRSIGVGRDDGKTLGEFAPIFFDTTRYLLLQSGTFWLSPSPDIPSKGWDAALNRICTFALLESKFDHKKLWVFNTHFDHVGLEARMESATLISEKFAEFVQIQQAPCLLMGDFNAEPDAYAILKLKESFKDLSCSMRHHHLCSGPTFNGFTTTETDDKIIDYFFGTPELLSRNFKVIKDPFETSYPSDHFPIVVEFFYL